jgi:DNA polymerase-4
MEALRTHVHAQALRVGRRLRELGVKTRVVQLKVKYSDFKLITRRTTLGSPTDDGQELYRAAMQLFERVPLDRAVRLTGVSAQKLGGASQLGLFDENGESSGRADRLNEALDRIAERFGSRAVTTADLSNPEPGLDDEEDEARRQVGAPLFDAPPKRRP